MKSCLCFPTCCENAIRPLRLRNVALQTRRHRARRLPTARARRRRDQVEVDTEARIRARTGSSLRTARDLLDLPLDDRAPSTSVRSKRSQILIPVGKSWNAKLTTNVPPARPVEALAPLPPPRAPARRDHQAVPRLPRPPPHGPHARGGSRKSGGLRPAQGRAFAGRDHGAVYPCRSGALSRGRAAR